MIPISAVGDGMGLNITVVSYRDRMDFGLVSCRELVPDLQELADDLVDSFTELEQAAGQTSRASCSLMTIESPVPRTSVSSRARPAIISIPNTSKYPGQTTFMPEIPIGKSPLPRRTSLGPTRR